MRENNIKWIYEIQSQIDSIERKINDLLAEKADVEERAEILENAKLLTDDQLIISRFNALQRWCEKRFREILMEIAKLQKEVSIIQDEHKILSGVIWNSPK
ncbi:hypothetical protein [Viridibacillus arvi]|uniref:hypothetical protein n=1 Tax=Viridibacillus arvi TaxID=263475 RepID=UPI0034CEB4AF